MGDPYAPIVIRTVEDGGYAPSSSASYGAAGTSGGYSDDRDDSPNASNRKRGGIVGQLFGSSASAPVVLAIGVLCLVVGAAVGVLASPSLATGRRGIGAAPVAVATAREGIAREGVDAVPRVVAPALERAASPSRPEDELEKARLQESRDADLNRLAALGDAPTEADDASAEDVVETPDTKVFPALGAKPDAADARARRRARGSRRARASPSARRLACATGWSVRLIPSWEPPRPRARARCPVRVPSASRPSPPPPRRTPDADADAARGATTTSRFSATTTRKRRRRAATKARARAAPRPGARLGVTAAARAATTAMRLATANPTTRPTTRTALTATRTAPAA